MHYHLSVPGDLRTLAVTRESGVVPETRGSIEDPDPSKLLSDLIQDI